MKYEDFVEYLKAADTPWDMQERFLQNPGNLSSKNLEHICRGINSWISADRGLNKKFTIKQEHLVDLTGVAVAMEESYGLVAGTPLNIRVHEGRLVLVAPKQFPYVEWRTCVFLRVKLPFVATIDPLEYLPLASLS
jgi:hypothetical protein